MVIKRNTTVVLRPDGFQMATKDMLDMLKEGKLVPVSEILCVQVMGKEYLVTLRSTEWADKLSGKLRAEYKGRSMIVDSVENPKQYIKVYNLPFEISNGLIGSIFEKYGRVLHVRSDKHQFTNLYNGDRTVIMQTTQQDLDNIPDTIDVEGFTGRVFCKKSNPKCRYCKEEGHIKANCPELRCHTCGVNGHLARECPQRKCSHCMKYGHWVRQCPMAGNENDDNTVSGGEYVLSGQYKETLIDSGRQKEIDTETQNERDQNPDEDEGHSRKVMNDEEFEARPTSYAGAVARISFCRKQ